MKKTFSTILPILILFVSCKGDDLLVENLQSITACSSEGLLETFTAITGQDVYIYENGKLYTATNGQCNFEVQFFNPDFLNANYVINSQGIFLITNGTFFPTKSNFIEDFESVDEFKELFIGAVSDTHLYWTNFTLQSPAAQTVNDYIALNQCIIDGSCAFIDNKIELVNDPSDVFNTVLKFTSVAPTENMVTSKSSITSSLNFYEKDSDVWFQADYLIESGMPFSIVDFENAYFYEHPGPRVVLRNNKLEIENKFGAKLNFENNSEVDVPLNDWFTVKVHFKYSNKSDGVVELWQDGVQIISATGINLPTSNSIQNIVEVGISASSAGCVLLLDNMRISTTAF